MQINLKILYNDQQAYFYWSSNYRKFSFIILLVFIL